jgi:RNA polymerase sigma factor (sigma-70 family)
MAHSKKPRSASAPPAPDENLVAPARSEEGPAACNRLEEDYQKAVVVQVARLARLKGCQPADTTEAQDLAVTDWLCEAQASFKPYKGTSFPAFLAQVVERRFGDFLRQRRRQARHIGGYLTPDGLLVRSEHEPEPVADRRHDPARLVEEAEAQARCEQALRLLTEKQQQLCELRRAGFAQEEIACQMGLSPSTVKRWLGLVEKKLRLALRCHA